MSVSDDYKEYILECLETTGNITHRKMFGAVGIYVNGFFCAIIDDNILYFKVDDSNRDDFEKQEMKPFQPMPNEKPMSYYEVPADVLEDDSLLIEWVNKAVEVARSKPPKKRKKKK